MKCSNCKKDKKIGEFIDCIEETTDGNFNIINREFKGKTFVCDDCKKNVWTI